MATILLVEDDEQFRRMLQRTLERAGYRVVPAADGREALNRIDAVRPDLVLTDLIMPDMEGLETIQALRRREPPPPIVAMSGGGRMSPDNYLLAARRMGARETLAKPFSTAELLAAIGTALAASAVEPA